MLVLTRKIGERILIKSRSTGESIIISCEKIYQDKSSVRIGFTDNAHEFIVVREEVDQQLFDEEVQKHKMIKAGYDVSRSNPSNRTEENHG